MADTLRIVYAGTPEFAVPALQALIASEHEVVAVYTQPDRPAGRGRKLKASPVKATALEAGIPVEQPLKLKKNPEAQQTLAAYNADLMVVAAYGLILPQQVLDMPRYGCVNIHASLLPRWRGAAPIQRAIWAGDAETGVTIMQMAKGLDTGDMLRKTSLPISADLTASMAHDRLAAQGAEALLLMIEDLQNHALQPEVQDEAQVTYAHKLSKDEALLDWHKSAQQLAREVMAFNAWPVAQTPYEKGFLRVWEAHALAQSSTQAAGTVLAESKQGIDIATGEGVLRVTRLQLPGGKPLAVHDFLNGRSVQGVCFAS